MLEAYISLIEEEDDDDCDTHAKIISQMKPYLEIETDFSYLYTVMCNN